MRIFWDYLLAVFRYWWAIVPGLLIVTWDFVERASDKPFRPSRSVKLAAVIVGLVVVQFLAYDDVRKQLAILNKESDRLRRDNATLVAQRNALNTESVALRAVALRGSSATAPSEADKTARKALRKSLGDFLLRGSSYREAILDMLDEPRHPESEIKAVDGWDRQLVRFVEINLGEERAKWMRAHLPSNSYPNGIYFREAQRAWDTLSSDMMKIQELLRDYPEF